MKIETRQEADTTIVALAGRMDALTAPEFEKAFNALIDEGKRSFIVNFKGVDYISSAGIRSILVVSRRLKADNGKLILAELTDGVRGVLDMTGFAKILEIYASVEEALTHL